MMTHREVADVEDFGEDGNGDVLDNDKKKS